MLRLALFFVIGISLIACGADGQSASGSTSLQPVAPELPEREIPLEDRGPASVSSAPSIPDTQAIEVLPLPESPEIDAIPSIDPDLDPLGTPLRELGSQLFLEGTTLQQDLIWDEHVGTIIVGRGTVRDVQKTDAGVEVIFEVAKPTFPTETSAFAAIVEVVDLTPDEAARLSLNSSLGFRGRLTRRLLPSDAADLTQLIDELSGVLRLEGGRLYLEQRSTLQHALEAPALTIDPSKTYRATIDVAIYGEIVVELHAGLVPQLVNSFVYMAREGVYDGQVLSRNNDFIIVGDDPIGAGYWIDSEYHPTLRHDGPGVVSMVNAQNAGVGIGSQFFITLEAVPMFDAFDVDGTPRNCDNPAGFFCHPVIGQVVAGRDVLRHFTTGDIVNGISVRESNGLTLMLPLPQGKSWLLTVEAGGVVTSLLGGGVDRFHTNETDGFYSLDFDDLTSEDGELTNVPVLAAGRGTVVRVSDDPGGYGVFVEIDHGGGYSTLYAHLKDGSVNVAEGSGIGAGHPLGIVGSTGNSTGTHLHFEVSYNSHSQSGTADLENVKLAGRKLTEYKVEPAPQYYSSGN